MYAEPVSLILGVDAWFSGRDLDRNDVLPVGAAGNLSHRRPHRPVDLARERSTFGAVTGTDPARWHLMGQVHGHDIAVVGPDTPPGAELRGVDGVVTHLPDAPLLVQVADCVPVLLAGPATIAAVHAGRRGVVEDVVGAAVGVMTGLGDDPGGIVAAIGPAIGGCCYEVPASLRDDLARRLPAAAATTSWGTPAVDLPTSVTTQLHLAGVRDVRRVGGCTRCDPDRRWFSHRADPTTGRQVGLVVRRSSAAPGTVAA